KKTTRKSCAGVWTFLARTKALNSRAICAVSGGRSCKSSSKSVSGSVRGNCMVCFSCGREGYMFPPCSMPSFPTIYSLSWRLCLAPPRHRELYDGAVGHIGARPQSAAVRGDYRAADRQPQAQPVRLGRIEG